MDTYYSSSDFSDDDMDEDPSDEEEMSEDYLDEFYGPSDCGSNKSSSTGNRPLASEFKGVASLLYDKMKIEEDVDVDIFIGPLRKCVKAHKIVVASGLSNVLATQLNAPLWKNERNDGTSIEFPEDVSEEAAHVFIKFLYIEDLSESLSVEVLLDVLSLADLYMVECLLNWCDNCLRSRINVANSIEIYQGTRRFLTKVGRKAYDYIKGDIHNIIFVYNEANNGCPMDALTWESLLKEDYLLIEEIKLFQLLLKWKNENVTERGEKFKELVRLIRFPLIKREQIDMYVVPSNALSSNEIDNLIHKLLHLDSEETCECQNCQIVAKIFNCNKRRARSVVNSQELSLTLKKCIPGDEIILAEGLYEGKFSLFRNKVKIIGASNHASIIKGCRAITVAADGCTLENLKISMAHESIYAKDSPVIIIGKNNVIKSLRIEVEHGAPLNNEEVCGLKVYGSFSSLKDIHVEKFPIGVLIHGEGNKVANVKIEECKVGFRILQNRNELNNLTLNNVQRGVDILGIENVVTNVNFNYAGAQVPAGDIIAISMTGQEHFLENCVCKGLEAFSSKSWCIYMNYDTDSARIRNCGPGQVFVNGENNYLENVDAGCGTLKILGRGHRIENCSADTLINYADEMPPTHFAKCKFSQVRSIILNSLIYFELYF